MLKVNDVVKIVKIVKACKRMPWFEKNDSWSVTKIELISGQYFIRLRRNGKVVGLWGRIGLKRLEFNLNTGDPTEFIRVDNITARYDPTRNGSV
jgi:hypothetical protein